MGDKRKRLRLHIKAAKEWLGQAEDSLEKERDIQGDLKLMLAKAGRKDGCLIEGKGLFEQDILRDGLADKFIH